MHKQAELLPANTADFTFGVTTEGKLTQLDDTQRFKVVSFTGTEGLSELYCFRVELCSDDPEVKPGDFIGKMAVLGISAGGDARRFVNGLIRAFKRTGRASDKTSYFTAEIVPVQWMMTKRIGCWIHQEHNTPDMSVPGIIKQVFQDAGITPDLYRFALEKDYPKRDFVVQYRESEWDFVARLIEDEGIFFYFEHLEDRHVMVFGDSGVAHMPVSKAVIGGEENTASAEFPYRTLSGLVHEREFVFDVEEQHELAINYVELDDFNFEKVPGPMEALVQGKDFDFLYYNDYPHKYQERPEGMRYAQLRLEEYQCARRTLQMSGTARNFVPGYTFSMIEHPVESLNGAYILTHVTHHARQAQSGEEDVLTDGTAFTYQVEVRVIPADVPFRAPRKTRKPCVQGSQTAIVVGPRSEEIYTDKYGRVKVQFHWDPQRNWNEKSSCWIRVSQGWAGGKYGFMFLPRVGHEVIVDFLEGDPDRPIITGRVYNADLTPIWDLPEHKNRSGIKSKSTPEGDGASALIFDDTAGEEYVHLHSQFDMEVTCERDRDEKVGRDINLIVEDSRIELIKRYHECEVKLDHDEKVHGNKSQTVKGSVSESFGSHSESTGSYTLSVNKGEAVIEAASGITLKCGGNFIRIHGGGIDISGTVVNINSGGSAANGSGGYFPEFIGPYEASHVSHGYDVVYVPQEEIENQPVRMALVGTKPPTDEQKKTTWIEIELVDEAGQPWPNEPYEVTTPDGKVIRGSLDAQGQAHVNVEVPGMCQIAFPRLDMEAWQRA